jgi:hypothetical protein
VIQKTVAKKKSDFSIRGVVEWGHTMTMLATSMQVQFWCHIGLSGRLHSH